MAQRFSIVERTRELEVAPSSATDFCLANAQPFEASEILLSGQDDRPRYTLYCLDTEDDTALFVETPSSCDLEAAPFFSAAQHEHAQAVITVSRQEFFDLAEEAIDPGPRLGFVQSVGRSGTTLASRALGTCANTYSLSEPDVLLQLLALGPRSPSSESAWRCVDLQSHDALLDASLRLLCHEALQRENPRRVIIKPRSQFCEAFSSLLRLYPRSETLFLTREPLPWLESVFSAFLRELDCDDAKIVGSFEQSLGSYIPLIQARITPGAPQAMGALWALHYVSAQREFDAARRAGMRAYALRFEDLQKDPRFHFETLFDRWGLVHRSDDLARILSQDSQAGSGLARKSGGRADYVPPAHQIEAGKAIFEEFGLLGTCARDPFSE